MPPTDAKQPPSAVTRVVYMAQYRPDLDVVGCTLAKTMAHAKLADEWLVKGVCRKITGRPRCAPRSWWCRQTVIGHRASPLADLMLEAGVFRGRHLLHHWCGVQARVALSTGEAELYAQILCLQELLILQNLMEELRPAEYRTLKCDAEVNSTARKSIMLRHGVRQL